MIRALANGGLFDWIYQTLCMIPGIIIGLSLHEYAHAYVADKCGDPTPRSMGRLSVDPRAHVDWFGLISLALIHFGWGKPVVYNPSNIGDSEFPVFAKPIVGYSARGTKKLNSQEEVRAYLDGKDNMLVVEYLPGEEFTVDCFTDRHGELRVAKILNVENNPESDKLYVETLDDGTGTERIIQSGLRDYLKPEDLLGKHIILAFNLAPRKMRGIESHGMLLAADYKDADGKDCVEPLEAPWAAPGTRVILEGADANAQKPAEITADDFFAVEIKVVDNNVTVGGVNLTVGGQVLKTVKTVNGDIH